MSSQRPFLSNFLAIFRTHTPPIAKSAPSLTAAASTATASAQNLWTAATAVPLKQSSQSVDKPVTSPRPINAKSGAYNPATSSAADRQLQASISPLQHNVSPQTHLPRSPSSGSLPMYGPPNKPQPSYPTLHETRRARRGSDSSSDSGGFREVRSGGEKWYIGGITASGEEKYYKLGMVRRERSADRISADQLSL
ncbi:hypothetical protein AMS68_007311 [Peltaster fructicola]|uniref:Uncharacterized protein n=1 Tax=Peltaster fructicola TaxID=286661 RepID=A0A6H0Y455_9PEZI|nr:hypothetical protein AMS68_007311 [Peltaster fructicola]